MVPLGIMGTQALVAGRRRSTNSVGRWTCQQWFLFRLFCENLLFRKASWTLYFVFLLPHINLPIYTWECIGITKEMCIEILKDVYAFSTSDYKKFYVLYHQSVCIYGPVCPSVAPEWLDGCYLYLVYNYPSLLGRCPKVWVFWLQK
jgi:hypothetical protein